MGILTLVHKKQSGSYENIVVKIQQRKFELRMIIAFV